ncbi:MAG: hypothetical protein JSS79_21155 [Bacteroidetes bacterium]|nr:hypothetical protein [Bacteroidota bacterium]
MNASLTIWTELDAVEQFFVTLAAIFFVCAVALIFFLIGSRLIKTYRSKTETRLQTIFQQSLNSLIIHTSTDRLPSSSYQFHLNELRKAMNAYPCGRQVMINLLIKLKKSLSGTSSKMLDTIYLHLDLPTVSKKKLKATSWKIQVQGIRELSEMNYYLPKRMNALIARTKNETLREEIFMAHVRLNKKNPLALLDRYDGAITPWMRINLHRFFSQYDGRTLPDFSRWFEHPREDVVMFCMSMARQFKQFNAVPALVKLLSHKNPMIVASAIRSLSDLEAFHVVDQVVAQAQIHWSNERISLRIIRFIARLGHLDAHTYAIEKYLEHKNFKVRLAAVKTLTSMGENAQKQLTLRNKLMGNRLTLMIGHASEPLLT